MVAEKTIAVIAAVLVAISFAAGAGLLTGAATTGDQFDFSIKSVSFPEKISRFDDFVAKATFTSTRILPSSFVTYDYRVLDEKNAEYFRVREGVVYVHLPTGESTSNLETVSLSKAGKYKVKVTIDYLNQFGEIDESNNVYETTITVV